MGPGSFLGGVVRVLDLDRVMAAVGVLSVSAGGDPPDVEQLVGLTDAEVSAALRMYAEGCGVVAAYSEWRLARVRYLEARVPQWMGLSVVEAEALLSPADRREYDAIEGGRS